jgi:hypothetical protein
MEDFIRVFCTHYNVVFDNIIQQYNSNTESEYYIINCIISYKIENNKDVIYKEDIPKIFSNYYVPYASQEKFMENVMKDIKGHNLDINNLKFKDCYSAYLDFYYMSTFLEHEPVDIKIALKE